MNNGQIVFPVPDIIPDVVASLLAGTGTAPAGSLIPFPTLAGVLFWGICENAIANAEVVALGVNKHYLVAKAAGAGTALAVGDYVTIAVVAGQSYGEVNKAGAGETIFGIVLTAANDAATQVHILGPFMSAGGNYKTL